MLPQVKDCPSSNLFRPHSVQWTRVQGEMNELGGQQEQFIREDFPEISVQSDSGEGAVCLPRFYAKTCHSLRVFNEDLIKKALHSRI